MRRILIAVLCTIPLFFPVYLCSIGALFIGYIMIIAILMPLWFLIEMAGIIPPFHGVGNTLLYPWKAFLVIALVITIIILVEIAKEKIEGT